MGRNQRLTSCVCLVKSGPLGRNQRSTNCVCGIKRSSSGEGHRCDCGCVRDLVAASLYDQHNAILLSRLPRTVSSHWVLYSAVALQLGVESGAIRVGSARCACRSATTCMLCELRQRRHTGAQIAARPASVLSRNSSTILAFITVDSLS